MVFPTINTGGRASTTTVYGGAELTKIQQLMSGINIASTDTTNKPIIATEVTFNSGVLKFFDSNNTNKIAVITPDISIDTQVRFPATMTSTVADNEFLMANTNQVMKNKTIDASQNALTNIDNSNLKSNIAIDWTKINKTGSKLTDFANTPVASPTDGQALVYSSTSAAWVYYTAIQSADINLPNKTGTLPTASTTSVPIYRNDMDVNTQRVYISKLEGGSPVLIRLA